MRQLGVMAKFWEPGAVKTRLAAAVGPAAASRIHLALVRATLCRFAATAERRVLVFTPEARRAEFASLAGPAWQIEPQTGGDLGQRMERYFADSFGAGREFVVLIGADSPSLPTAYVEQAFDLLRDREVVLGPASDGGYCLVGAARRVPPIFSGIAWGGPRVWRDTLARLAAAGIAWAQLPAWHDVDTAEDLALLRRELESAPPADDALAALRNEITAVLES